MAVRPARGKFSRQTYGGSAPSTDRRMSAERVARLALVAAAHSLEEAWVALFPILPLLYFNQYAPTITKR